MRAFHFKFIIRRDFEAHLVQTSTQSSISMPDAPTTSLRDNINISVQNLQTTERPLSPKSIQPSSTKWATQICFLAISTASDLSFLGLQDRTYGKTLQAGLKSWEHVFSLVLVSTTKSKASTCFSIDHRNIQSDITSILDNVIKPFRCHKEFLQHCLWSHWKGSS